MNRTYTAGFGTERLRAQGEKLAVKVLILPALFDEANRMRRFTVQLMAALVQRGVGSLLPDLPGTGESEVELRRIGRNEWSSALWALRQQHPDACRQTVAIRAGALLDRFGLRVLHAEQRHWRLCPVPGAQVVRDLDRVDSLGGSTQPGWPISASLRAMLAAAVPKDEARVAGLTSGSGPVDIRFDGVPLWRLAEPGEDLRLVAQAADDIAAWVER